jgi:hypothetical protein
MNDLSQDSQSSGQDLNLGSPKYETGMLTNQMICSVNWFKLPDFTSDI